MSKKHFILFAETINNKFQLGGRSWRSLTDAEQTAALTAVDVIVQVARQSNDRFDENRFRSACGVPTV